MLRKLLSLTGRVALLFVVGFTAFAFLIAGIDEVAVRGPAKTELNSPSDEAKLASARLSEGADGNAEKSNATKSAAPPAVQSAELQESLTKLNACFETKWREADLEVAPRADWLTVCRRLSLSMVGTGLSLQEIRDLESLPEQVRISTHLERLLADPRYHDYWAERFTRLYVGAVDGPFIAFRRRRFRHWLSDQLASNRPYDQLVRNLITAEGLPTDRPEVNFLTVTLSTNEEGQPDPIRLAARTSRAFLGLRIDCMQCHDDFLGNVSLGDGELREGTQQDFHALAAFYSGARFNGLQGIRTETRPYEFQFLNADAETTVEPAVPFASHLLPKEGKPRNRLAAWLVHPENKQASRALVGRIWALLYGHPITSAVDNIPLTIPSHPAHDLLADDFVQHGFDMRRLIRLIVLSKPYQMDSAAPFEITELHEQQWAAFPLVRLRPEQVAGTVIQAARIKTIDRDSSLVIQLMKFGGVNDFVTRYGDIGEDEFDQDNVTITQRLIMLNGELVKDSIENNPVLNSSAHILMFAADDKQAIESTYLCVLNRFPDEDELAIFSKRLAESKDREATIADLFWVLLNCSELAWNH